MKLILIIAVLLAWLQPLSGRAQTIDTVKIYFDTWKFKLTQEHRKKLKPFAQAGAADKSVKYMVFGYADPVGSPEKNLELSEQRANAVVAFLISDGVNRNQIVQTVGKGERQVSGSFAEEKHVAEDRRVEVLVRHPPKGPDDLLNLPEGESMVLRSLTFLPGRHVLRPEAFAELERLALVLRQNPKVEIEIQGHICCESLTDGIDLSTGQPNLSYARAKFVFDWLVEKGIEPKRMQYVGLGSKKRLVYPEVTEADRNQNRRVEIRLLKK